MLFCADIFVFTTYRGACMGKYLSEVMSEDDVFKTGEAVSGSILSQFCIDKNSTCLNLSFYNEFSVLLVKHCFIFANNLNHHSPKMRTRYAGRGDANSL